MSTVYDVLKPVKSSMFSRAGYDEARWALLLEFKSTGKIREYSNVAPEMGDEALTAESIGKWWNANVRNNPAWEFETLGADPSQQPEPPKAKAKQPESLDVMDSDIRLVDPGWNGTTIEPVPEQKKCPKCGIGIDSDGDGDCYACANNAIPGVKSFQCGTGEMGTIYWSKQPGDPEKFPEGQPDPQVDRVDVYSQHPDGSFTLLDGGIDVGQAAIARQPIGEVLGAWTAPQSAAEALDMLAERDTEIAAIIAQNVQTGQQALTVKVDSAEHRLSASETLSRLVTKKDTTFNALDPLRKTLYDAYSEAGAKVKAGVDPLDKGITHIKKEILTYDQAQERERQRLIREDTLRRENEARRLQEKAAAAIKLADVTDALEAGDEQRAQTLFDAPAEAPRPYIPPQYIAPAAPKVEGQSTSTTWKVDRDLVESDETGQAYIASITKLLRAIKDGSYAIEQAAPLLSWDFGKADKLAGALMSAFNVPGLSALPVGTLRVSRGKKK
jgi:hypothetical protein